MMTDRNQIRQMYLDAWQQHLANQPLSDLQQNIVNAILMHPEYHDFFKPGNHENAESLEQNFQTDNNPFLHLGLHLSLQEQIQTNRPNGIRSIYQQLAKKLNDIHVAEHKMMDVMANILWDAQQNNKLPSEAAYLDKLRQIT